MIDDQLLMRADTAGIPGQMLRFGPLIVIRGRGIAFYIVSPDDAEVTYSNGTLGVGRLPPVTSITIDKDGNEVITVISEGIVPTLVRIDPSDNVPEIWQFLSDQLDAYEADKAAKDAQDKADKDLEKAAQDAKRAADLATAVQSVEDYKAKKAK